MNFHAVELCACFESESKDESFIARHAYRLSEDAGAISPVLRNLLLGGSSKVVLAATSGNALRIFFLGGSSSEEPAAILGSVGGAAPQLVLRI